MATIVHIPLDDAPEHAAALGRLLGHWAFLEVELETIMRFLLGIDQFKAKFIWQEFTSAKAKIALIQRLNHHFTANKDSKESLDKLLSKAQELNSDRNAFVHALWAGDEKKLTRFRNTPPGNYKKAGRMPEQFSPQDVQNVVDKIAELSQALTLWQFGAFGVLTRQHE